MTRTRQPQKPVRLNPSHWFNSSKLRSVICNGGGALWSPTNSIITSAAMVTQPTANGLAKKFNGTSSRISFPSNLSSGKFSITALFGIASPASKMVFEYGPSGGDGVGGVYIYCSAASTILVKSNSTGGVANTVTLTYQFPSVPTWVTIQSDITNNPRLASVYANGVLQASNSVAVAGGVLADTTLYVGNRENSSLWSDGTFGDIFVVDDNLTAAQIAELHANPYAIFVQPRVWVQIGAAAGGGPTSWTYAPSGGLAIAGTAPRLRTKVHTATGGVSLGSTAPVLRTKVYTPSGGVTVAGAAPVLKSKIYTPSGGLAIAGTAPRLKGKVYGVSGGVTLAGAATTSYSPVGSTSYPYLPSGGIALAGAATTTATKFYVAPVSGGIVLDGTAASAFTSTGATGHEYLPSGGITLGGAAAIEGPGGLGGRPIFARRRKRYLVKDRVYDDLDPADVIAAAAEAGIDLGDVREVVKEPTAQKSKPRRADDEGREYWLPQEFWGRAAATQKLEATAPLGEEFQREVEALRASGGPLQARMELRRRQEEEAIILLMA
jgi:hypothetical protein